MLGAIPFGRVRLGAAGALFTGLVLSDLAPQLGYGMEIVQTLGLALFVDTAGISAGAAFFSTLNRQLPLLLVATVSTVVAAIATILLGNVLGLEKDLGLGLFTGTLTAASALDAASRLTGTADAPPGPPAEGLAEARDMVERRLRLRLSEGWADADALRLAIGRRAPSDDERGELEELGPRAGMLPLSFG